MVLWNIVGQGIRYGVKGTAAFLNSETGKKTSEATGKAFRAAKEAAKDFASEFKTQNPATKGETPSNTQEYVLDDLQIPWQVMQQLGYERVPGLGPVLLGRELLIQAFQLFQSDDGPRKASIAISAAVFSKSLINFTAFLTEFLIFFESDIFSFPNFCKNQLISVLICINES